MKQNLSASLENTDTGESSGAVGTERVSLSSLEIVFDDFGMEILKKTHQFITKQLFSAWVQFMRVEIEQRYVSGIAF